MSETKKTGGFHYAWIVAIVNFAILLVTMGLTTTAFSVLSAYYIPEWGIDHTTNSLLVTVRTAAVVVGLFLINYYYKILSYRVGMMVGCLIGAVGFALMILGQNLIMAYVAVVLIGLSHAFAGYVGVACVIDKWFKKHNGLILGACATASSVATMFMPTLVALIVEASGLNFAFICVAITFAALGLIGFVVIRDDPSKLGLKRYGEDEVIVENKKPKKVLERPYAPSKAHIYMMFIASFLIGPMCYSANAVFTLNLTTAGWATVDAAALISLHGTMLLIFKFVFGRICDVVQMRKVGFIFFGCVMIGHFLLAQAPNGWFNFTWGIVAYLFYSFGAPLSTTGLVMFAYDIAEEGRYDKFASQYTFVYNVGALIFNLFPGMIADATGNYSIVFYIFALCACLGMVICFMVYNGAHKRYKKLHAEGKIPAANTAGAE